MQSLIICTPSSVIERGIVIVIVIVRDSERDRCKEIHVSMHHIRNKRQGGMARRTISIAILQHDGWMWTWEVKKFVSPLRSTVILR